MEAGLSPPHPDSETGSVGLARAAATSQGTREPRRKPGFTLHGAPLKFIAVTQQRVSDKKGANGVPKREDILDSAWLALLETCGCLAMRIPNEPHRAIKFLDAFPFDGLLLTCGNELAAHGGDAPERDKTEFTLLTHAIHKKLPVLGVGRGMQVIQKLFSIPLCEIDGHAATQETININGEREAVYSDHRFGATDTSPDLNVWARADDGVIKAVKSATHNITGIMWRPEQEKPFHARDLNIIRRAFHARHALNTQS